MFALAMAYGGRSPSIHSLAWSPLARTAQSYLLAQQAFCKGPDLPLCGMQSISCRSEETQHSALQCRCPVASILLRPSLCRAVVGQRGTPCAEAAPPSRPCVTSRLRPRPRQIRLELYIRSRCLRNVVTTRRSLHGPFGNPTAGPAGTL